jgi:hypothetical protein
MRRRAGKAGEPSEEVCARAKDREKASGGGIEKARPKKLRSVSSAGAKANGEWASDV